jgi:choline dehydrogenase-like flavoprotein
MEKDLNAAKGTFEQVSSESEASWIRRHRALLVALGIAIGGCASPNGGLLVSPAEEDFVSQRKEVQKKDHWSFMSESQKEAARYLSTLPYDHIEEKLRKSKAIEIPLILPVIQAGRGVQGALESNDVQAIREKSAQFYALAMAMGEGESQRKFHELQEDPCAAMELMMFQDYFIPALEHALRLSAIGG